MTRDIAPAIRTQYDERYSDIERLTTIGSDTTFHRGFGETGTRVELVDFFESTVGGRLDGTGGCPRCGETKMVLSRRLNPDGYDDAAFYCTNLKCPHFVQDAVEYDMDKIRADQPEMWDNTAECPSCGTRHTVEVCRHDRKHNRTIDADTDIVEAHCDQCAADIGVAETKDSNGTETNADT